MITFKQYLNEEYLQLPKITPTTLKKIYKTLNTDYSDGLLALKNRGVLFRGYSRSLSGKKNDIFHVDATKSVRSSKDTNNIYQVMMDASPSLKEYPSRSSSLICSSSFNTAFGYSAGINDTYMVVPKNGTKIAASKNSDFITTFVTKDYTLRRLDEVIWHSYSRFSNYVKPTSYNDMMNHFTSVPPYDDYMFGLMMKLNIKPEVGISKGFYEFVKNKFTPENLKLKLLPFGTKIDNDVECWFSGECVLINGRLLQQMIELMISEDPSSVDESYHDILEY